MKKVYLIAVVFALIAGFATFMFAKELSDKASYVDAQKKSVVVAIKDVPKSTTITAENFVEFFKVQDVVESYCLPNAIQSQDDAMNIVIRQDLYTGEQLTTKKIITKDSKEATLSLVLPDGYVAYPVSAGGTQAADGFIAVGDKVDFYVYEGNQATVPLSDLEVLKVSNRAVNRDAQANNTEIVDYSSITLIVTEEQAEQIMQIENSGSKYKLVLKPRSASNINYGTVEVEEQN